MMASSLSIATMVLAAMATLVVTAPSSSYNPSGFTGGFISPPPAESFPSCTEENIRVRQDFDTMAPEARKAYTDAVLCLMDQPSQLDQTLYPAAINRYFDYAVIHVNRTKVVHLDGFFLTWHRYFLHLYEEDLIHLCSYTGSFPYWNWPATADNLTCSAVFDGSEYSMSGDGLYNDTGSIVLGPTLELPQGSGGGCVTSGPFANLITTMQTVDISVILNDEPLPATAFDYKPSCFTRDLNTYVAQTYTTYSLLDQALTAPDAGNFTLQVNGLLGGSQLGLHSGAHFTLGAPGSSLFVSPMDPIWYPLHAMLDNVYTSWQIRNPTVASQLNGTMTANNLPASEEVTLNSTLPDWGYLQPAEFTIEQLLNTTGGPFCYRYDQVL